MAARIDSIVISKLAATDPQSVFNSRQHLNSRQHPVTATTHANTNESSTPYFLP
jgi:hypothetical protein